MQVTFTDVVSQLGKMAMNGVSSSAKSHLHETAFFIYLKF
jgi:hypothetical protein